MRKKKRQRSLNTIFLIYILLRTGFIFPAGSTYSDDDESSAYADYILERAKVYN